MVRLNILYSQGFRSAGAAKQVWIKVSHFNCGFIETNSKNCLQITVWTNTIIIDIEYIIIPLHTCTIIALYMLITKEHKRTIL